MTFASSARRLLGISCQVMARRPRKLLTLLTLLPSPSGYSYFTNLYVFSAVVRNHPNPTPEVVVNVEHQESVPPSSQLYCFFNELTPCQVPGFVCIWLGKQWKRTPSLS